jgi:CheY-like chemotaxis protein
VNVFISYQRADTLFAAHAVGYAIRLGEHEAFVDTGSIGGGQPYRAVIDEEMHRANLLVALIGPRFDVGRLHEPTNVVAFEWRRAQFYGAAVVPVLVDDRAMPSDSDLPPELRWFTTRNAFSMRPTSLSADIDRLVKAIPSLAVAPRRAARVLWVDDNPANNELERKRLRPHGIVFDNVVSTEEALRQLEDENYDLVITDLGRRKSSDRSGEAGETFLEHPVLAKGGPPVIVYAGTWAARRRDELKQRGALDVMANREHLVATVLVTLGRATEGSELDPATR